jgi:hypothetical protein
MYTLISPLRTKEMILNLNQYRNAHFFKLNNSKTSYKAIMKEQIEQLPIFNKVSITYTVFFGSKRKTDISNVCSIVDKYFCDALVELGKLPDDNYDYIQEVNYRYGGIDKDNPRVEITLA